MHLFVDGIIFSLQKRGGLSRIFTEILPAMRAADKDLKLTVFAPASSNKNGGDKRSYPALGYEFIENGQSISALQYFGGGALGYNKNIVWIHNSLDEKVKLILAAASTAILQIKTDSYQEP